MVQKLFKITIRDLITGFKSIGDEGEGGVTTLNGKLNIRPAYQRAFVYEPKEETAVINTILDNGFLGVLTFSLNGDNPITQIILEDNTIDILNDTETYELIDGQQRTTSICNYIDGKFTVKNNYFKTLSKEKRDEILNYKIYINIIQGTTDEKYNWFKTINIAGKPLEPQELRNATYTGTWLTDAKNKFSSINGQCNIKYSKYLNGDRIRQDYLETALKWYGDYKNYEQYRNKNDSEWDVIRETMSRSSVDDNANKLWEYFENVFKWVYKIFGDNVKIWPEMKGLDWGLLYNEFGKNKYDSEKIQKRVKELYTIVEEQDPVEQSISNIKGIFKYVLTGNESFLSIRSFKENIKNYAYKKQKGKCNHCGKSCKIEDMHGDHIIPWSKGGLTNRDNCQMLCVKCNSTKSDRRE